MSNNLSHTCLPTRRPLPGVLDEKYCTVVFHLQGGRPSMSEFLFELSLHAEKSETVDIVRFQVGDSIGHPHA